MAPKLVITSITFFIFTVAFTQERIWTKQSTIAKIIAFEKEINPKPQFLSQNVSLSKDFYPLADKYQVTNPLIVQRKPIGYLPVYAEYYYTAPDSIVRLISYDWELDRYGNFFDKQRIWKEESQKFSIYNKEYEKIKDILITLLGIPMSTDTKAKEESSGRGKYYTRDSIWETDEIYANLNMIFESMTYRIRFTLYWKK